jgi:ubiquinone/menaquinone biosynthesis C-methylase UbiE
MKRGTAVFLLTFGALWAQDEEVKRKLFAEVHTALALRPGAVVADVGTGDNPLHPVSIATAVGTAGRVVCVDIKQKALDKLKQHLPPGTGNIEALLGKPDDPLLPRSTFDAVLISNAYHEMTGYQTMLAHLRDALKPTGRLVVIESIDKTRRLAAREQVKHHELSPEIVEGELSAAGFQLVSRIEPLVTSADTTVRYLVAAQPTAPQAARTGGGAGVQSDPWANRRVFEGKWEGRATGEPGKGVSSREYRFEPSTRFLSARNKSVYEPKTPTAKPGIHEDFAMFSHDRALREIGLRQFSWGRVCQ